MYLIKLLSFISQRKPVYQLCPTLCPLLGFVRDPAACGVPAGGRHHRRGGAEADRVRGRVRGGLQVAGRGRGGERAEAGRGRGPGPGLVPQIAPSVPQPVVQSRRRPLLGPSPG